MKACKIFLAFVGVMALLAPLAGVAESPSTKARKVTESADLKNPGDTKSKELKRIVDAKAAGVKKLADAKAAASSALEGDACVKCHLQAVSPGAVEQWHASRHARAGVSCRACHEANRADVTSWLHMGTYISSIVTPANCSPCHSRQTKEFLSSRHSTSALVAGSLDNYLGSFVEGHQVAVSGCNQCHGSRLKLSKNFTDGTSFRLDMEDVSARALARLKDEGKDPLLASDELRAQIKKIVAAEFKAHANKELKPEAAGISIDKDCWPNSGMGRINPDGTMGSCNACHSRHGFSKALARQPDNCGKCHMGPDHPQREIYQESKHGIAFMNRLSDMKLDSSSWVVGNDYSAAPTCATCHMSASRAQAVTHDTGLRIGYTLKPVLSGPTTSLFLSVDGKGEGKKITLSAEEKRQRMQEVCGACHGPTHIKNFYAQYDALIALYNGKFARPAARIMEYIKEHNYVDAGAPFGSDIEWKFFELWHHEGRRMRMGTAMMGPDYTQWHGAFEVASNFYFHFLPKAQEIADKHNDGGLKKLIADQLSSPDHQWMKGLSQDERKQMLEFYRRRYGENSSLGQPPSAK